MNKSRLITDAKRFYVDPPRDENSIQIAAGAWNYNYEQMSIIQILHMIRTDIRPE
jgi:hypothetical protein